jgi:hypothetical protein
MSGSIFLLPPERFGIMTSFTRMHWTGVGPISTPSPEPAAQWSQVHRLLSALERERAALETTRVGFTSGPVASLDREELRRQRQLSRRVANLKWMCVGGGISWIGFLLLSL